jgi:hypothetical protein
MKKVIYGKSNPNYKENISSLILSKNKNVKFLNADVVKKSGKNKMVVDMIDENGHKFSKTLEKIQSDKYLCCYRCARKLLDEDKYKKREKEWYNKVKEQNYKVLYAPSHITTESIVEIEDIDGYKYRVNARTIKDKRSPLRYSRYSNRKYLIYNLNIYKKNNNLLSSPIKILDDESMSHIHCEFKCICGNHFKRSINKWMQGKDLCNNCSQVNSSFEKLVMEYLEDKNIKYKKEFTIYNCRKDNPLPFDFWLKDFNCLIEIDGQQHFYPVDYGCGEEIAKKRFIQQKENDKIKDDYCKKNNIPLLRISYLEFKNNNWITLLNNFINSLRSNDS